ncbi:MAG: hypothetical protein ACRDD8_02945 [Bacteroidales bacterium]
MEHYKIKVSTPEESISVQELLFKRGYAWANNHTHPKNTDKRFLYTFGKMIKYGETIREFSADRRIELDVNLNKI